MAASNSYEEQRRRQMEENRRKLEELRLHHLSAAVREAAARPNPNPKPKPKPPDYLEGAQHRDEQGVYAAYDTRIWKGPTDEERAAAVAKAEELRRRIHRIRRPAFVKTLTHVCASRAKLMMIPKHFIKHLPAHDEAVVLVDEADVEFHMLCNASKQGICYLSKGWREFAVHHDLENGDCLVFQLIESAKFKVYIFRANPDYESDRTSDDSEDEQ
ncbi:B3 domain-containing protein Os06g0194400-like [Triticum dicoccoides]|uniref:B3 domain-containing protein Os06g0194400-like n=1 Tax=Triticum dicoccoides TaxID=85692 RepID=UPI0018905A21|nr:B3 domain-containing protein Os06g0194400-like [Triticum dicoccoides]